MLNYVFFVIKSGMIKEIISFHKLTTSSKQDFAYPFKILICVFNHRNMKGITFFRDNTISSYAHISMSFDNLITQSFFFLLLYFFCLGKSPLFGNAFSSTSDDFK